jgi:hypothetical protein
MWWCGASFFSSDGGKGEESKGSLPRTPRKKQEGSYLKNGYIGAKLAPRLKVGAYAQVGS